MKIWVVVTGRYDECNVVAAYTSERAAEEKAEEKRRLGDGAGVEETELIGDLSSEDS
jgi:hypothetical protein